MSDDERRLSDLLHGVTPQPPHQLDADAIMRTEQSRGRGFRYWPQLAAAGVVALLAVGTAFAVNAGSNGAPTQASGPSSAPLRRCGSLKVTSAPRVVAAGTGRSLGVFVRNVSSTSCRAQTPTVVAFTRGALSSPRTHLSANAGDRTLVLRPGQQAASELTWLDYPGWPTDRVTQLAVVVGDGSSTLITGQTFAISKYPPGHSRAGQTTLNVSALARFLLSHPTTNSPLPSKTATPTSGPSSNVKECILGMTPSLDRHIKVDGTRRSVNLYFTNNSGKACYTYPAPGLLALLGVKKNGIMINPVGSGFRKGVVQPGHRAYSTLTWTEDPKLPTTKYTDLSVVFPNEKYGKVADLPLTMRISADKHGNGLITCTGLHPYPG